MNLYIECFSGISGDMTLGALLDLGMPYEYLMKELKKLPVDGYRIDIRKAGKMGIFGTQVSVVLEEDEHTGHTHSHGHSHGHHSHGHAHEHSHGSSDNKKHQHHVHTEDRTFKKIKQLIQNSSLDDRVKDDSIAILQLIANAEGKIHNKAPEDVHFHEVGAVDSIVDIVGAAIGFNYFKFDKIISTPVELGGGFVQCAHGLFPVPAPATLDILSHIPVSKGTVNFETTTPTGAAILKHYVNEFTNRFSGTITKTMYGIGHRDADIPNVLRVSLSDEIVTDPIDTSRAMMVECNLDDMSPEYSEYIMQRLFEAGAQDVFYTSILMKKNRLAVKLSVLTDEKQFDVMRDIIFNETTTIGIRFYRVEKNMLDREVMQVDTAYGKIGIKRSRYRELIKDKPEYNDCTRAARENNVPVSIVIEAALTELKKEKR